MRKTFLLFLVLINMQTIVSAFPREAIQQLNNFFRLEQYDNAIEYISNYDLYGAPASVYYKVGLSYYYSFSENHKAISYLEIACRLDANIARSVDIYDVDDTRVPYEVFYYLGKTYFKNNQTDMALVNFSRYTQLYNNNPKINCEQEISWCVNTLKKVNNPMQITSESLGSHINTFAIENAPVASYDNSIIFFSSNKHEQSMIVKDKYYYLGLKGTDIFYVTRNEDGTYSDPVEFEHNTTYPEHPVSLSAEGNILYFAKKVKKHYDLYYSEFVNGRWETPRSMGRQINSRADEVFASVTSDGKEMYISSDKKSRKRGFDIYHSTRKPNGKWTSPDPVPGDVNTDYNEICPFVPPHKRVLYFSSDGYTSDNMGGYDVFSSYMISGKWMLPTNVGYPINTSQNDLCYSISGNEKNYKSEYQSFGGLDIMALTGLNGVEVQALDLSSLDLDKLAVNTDILAGRVEAEPEQVLEKNLGMDEDESISDDESEKVLDPIIEKDIMNLNEMALDDATQALGEMEPDYAGDVLGGVEITRVTELIGNMEVEKAVGIIDELEAETAVGVMDQIDPMIAGAIMDDMPIEKAMDIMEELPMEKAMNIMDNMEIEKSTQLQASMDFDNPVQVVDGSAIEDLDHQRRQDSISIAQMALERARLDSIEQARIIDSLSMELENFSLEEINIEEMDEKIQDIVIEQIKSYYSVEIAENNEAIFKTIHFDFNSAELLLLSKNELRILVEYMLENHDVKVEVIGHTDIIGNWDVNLNVSRSRAYSVYRFLLENKIAHNRIIYYGKGSAAPIDENSSEEGRANNRRVEIILLKDVQYEEETATL